MPTDHRFWLHDDEVLFPVLEELAIHRPEQSVAVLQRGAIDAALQNGESPACRSTHKVDPDVDETRTYLVQDLIASQRVRTLGFVKGVGAAPKGEPRRNLTGDPYYTDGLRVVFVLTDDPTSIDEIEFFDWKRPQRR